ncbi:MAG TPA: holin [Clostridiales bacterium]|nr:holin [Clostridiales bacterium]
MNIPTLKLSIAGTVGIVGGTLASFLGEWSNDLITLLILMVIDIVTGIIVAGVFHTSRKTEGGAIESNTMFKGLCKKIIMILLVVMAHRFDIELGTAAIRTGTIWAFIANEGISILENAALTGIKQLNFLTNALEVMNSKMSNVFNKKDGGGQ